MVMAISFMIIIAVKMSLIQGKGNTGGASSLVPAIIINIVNVVLTKTIITMTGFEKPLS